MQQVILSVKMKNVMLNTKTVQNVMKGYYRWNMEIGKVFLLAMITAEPIAVEKEIMMILWNLWKMNSLETLEYINQSLIHYLQTKIRPLLWILSF